MASAVGLKIKAVEFRYPGERRWRMLWHRDSAVLMRRTADIDPDLIASAEIHALENPS